mmetsp:Transcript_1554/g.3514  ORF Transcript_1554/g.3514 Transcript_1554/m.3514 type:complete len:185 (-) Transcript_1554:134-688(-)
MSLHSSKDQSHDAKEKTFMRLFGKVGADAYSIEDDSNYSKPVEFSSMPAAPPKFEYETPVEPEHRPDPKLSDDHEHVPHHPLASQRSQAGTELSEREKNFLKFFDHESREYSQAQPVEVDISKLPDHYTPEVYPDEAIEKRGIEELKDGVRQPWLPKGMEKKLSKRGEEMHEGFLKIFSGHTEE